MTTSLCFSYDSKKDLVSCFFQPVIVSILLAATTKGVLNSFKKVRLSSVCGWNPSFTSTTSIARSAMLPPLFLRVEKASWPGVSMKRRPGIFILLSSIRQPHIFLTTSRGTSVAPMCCVIPPTSPAATALFLTLSRIVVFPWSTWPSTVIIGCLMFVSLIENTFYKEHRKN